MKILHIGDIHLGCTLDNQRRHEEFEKVFAFLTGLAAREHVEAALFAGDVFDSGTPSVESQKLYFKFLQDLRGAGCRQIVAIAGNHDNANFLEAPQGLLQLMDIHVVGRPDPDHPEQEVIFLGPAEEPEAIVCAVPFLRERDVRGYVPEGEDEAQKSSALSSGIIAHYRQVYELADRLRAGREIPIIAMGHFYARGSTFAVSHVEGDDAEPDETVGTLEALDLDKMPGGFAYGALGHIHKPQIVPGHEEWRYAGSLLKMQLRKNMYAPQVFLLDTRDLAHPRGVEIPDGCFHTMCVIEGNMARLRQQLQDLAAEKKPVWVKPVYTGDALLPTWQIDLRLEMRETCVQIIHPEVVRAAAERPDPPAGFSDASLAELTPETVFRETLDAVKELSPEQKERMTAAYRRIQDEVLDPAAREEQAAAAPRGIMNFKRLHFKNINSLYGEHRINFEDEAFRKGIFLIFGDTGAGKSSILDAICLALYGCTPRAAGPTQERNDVMSEGAKEMFSELTFSLGGCEYRARFSHRCRQPGSQTKFADSQQQLFCDGKLITGAKREFEEKIWELIGLNMEQFTQCVLLAQGSFDAFLKAKPKDRSGILSSITGTAVYGRLGARINEEFSRIKDERDAERRLFGEISLLPDEKRTEYAQKQTEAEQRQKTLENALRVRELWKQAFIDRRKQEDDLKKAVEERDLLQRQSDDAVPKKIRLEEARRAEDCQNEYLTLCQARKDVENAEKGSAELLRQNEELQKEAAKAEADRVELEKVSNTISAEEEKKTKLFNDVRALDIRCREKESARSENERKLKSAQEEQSRHRQAFQAEEEKWCALEADFRAAQEYLAGHEADRDLEQKKAPWELRRQNLVQKENRNRETAEKSAALRKELDRKCGELAPLRKREQQAKEAVDRNGQLLENAGKRITELLDGHTEEEIGAQLQKLTDAGNFYKKAASYKEEREKLKQGEPCPLCGSVAHPLCTGEEIREDAFEKEIASLRKTLSELQKQKRLQNDANAGSAQLTAQLLNSTHQREDLEKEIARLQEELERTGKTLAEGQAAAEAEARQLAAEFEAALRTPWTDHAALPPELQKRIDACKSALEQSGRLEKGKRDYEGAKQLFEQQDKNDTKTVKELQDSCDVLKAEADELIRKRREMFDGDPDKAENELRARKEQARKNLDSARQKRDYAASRVENNRNNRDRLEQTLREQLRPALGAAETSFRGKLLLKNFPDEETFISKSLAPEDREKLAAELHELDRSLRLAAAVVTERRNTLEDTRKKLPENVGEEALLAELPRLEAEKKEADATVQDCKVAIEKDNADRRRSEDMRKRVEQLETQLETWTNLDRLFGTRDGARFTKVAQGYTFRNLVKLANENRLGILKQHFELVSNETEPLELDVIDHYRGGVMRTSRNLSGGESFEVSLALALGLSAMSSISQKASLGNVLLDEGFGTLDDKALDSALDLLMKLPARHKLVGIISHVEKLKDRIETQINVTNSGGMGMLSGAGIEPVPREAAPVLPAQGKTSGKRGRPPKNAVPPAGPSQE